MLTYAQIEAIHEAMRELETLQCRIDQADVYTDRDVHKCLAKIRAALAGEILRERTPVENWGDPKKCLVCGAAHDGTMCPSISLRDGGV